MSELRFRDLRADELEVRVSQVKESGLSLLVYKDARVDMKLLDEVVGPLNWKREHQLIGANLYCTVSIWDEDKHEWITKQDVGVESFTAKEKGQASDSFKRACTNLGIGRALYSAPFIWVKAADANIRPSGNGRFKCDDVFRVTDIEYEDGKISALTIRNETKNRICFKTKKAKAAPSTPDLIEVATDEQRVEIAQRARRLGLDPSKIYQQAGGEAGSIMSVELYEHCSIILDEIEDARAEQLELG